MAFLGISINFDKKKEEEVIVPSSNTVIPRKVDLDGNTSEISTEFTDHFRRLFDEGNLPRPDYYEFKEALNEMSGMDAATAIRTVFKIMSKSGLSKQTILSSIDAYIEMANKDKEGFMKALEQETTDRVASVRVTVQNKEKEVAALEKKLSELKLEISDLKERSLIDADRLGAKKTNYESAYNAAVATLMNDKSFINQTLQ